MPPKSAIQSQLNEHKQWLVGLRQDPRMTLAKIETELQNQRGVTATQNQLETYFTNLGQRKYLSPREWGTVLRALDSQKACGRVWDVYLSGRFFTEESLRRKRRHAKYGHSSALGPEDADRLIKQLPDGVTVKLRLPQDSSGGSQQHSITPQFKTRAISCAEPDGAISMRLDNISTSTDSISGLSATIPEAGVGSGSFDFQLASTNDANQAPLEVSPINLEAYPPPPFEVPDDLTSLIHSPSFELNFDREEFAMEFTDPSSFAGSNFFDICNMSTRPLPATLPRFVHSQDSERQSNILSDGHEYESSTSIVLGCHTHELSLTEIATLVVEDAASLHKQLGYTSHGPLPTTKELLDNLQIIVSIGIEQGDSCGALSIIGGPGLFTDQFVQLFLFSIVNNFTGIDAIPMKTIIKVVKQHEYVRSNVLNHLTNEASTIFARALAEKLLEAAIEACDAKTVHDLLALKIVNPDDIVCTNTGYNPTEPKSGHRMAPIQKAASLRNLDVVGLLLRFGADVNKTYDDGKFTRNEGTLECAIGLWGEYSPVDLRLVDLLLKNGATVTGRLVEASVRWGDAELVEKLISGLSPSEHTACFGRMVNYAAEYLRNDKGYRVVQPLFQACRDTHDGVCILSDSYDLGLGLSGAARRKNHELMNLLLPHTSQSWLNPALAAASRSGSHGLVKLLIERGARADGWLWHPSPGDGVPSTPLAEAIRRDDAELMDLFEKVGAWDCIGKRDHLKAAMHAIAETGNSTYLLRVLQLVPTPDPLALTMPLSVAIRAGQEEVALTLIEAGANLSAHSFEFTWHSRLPPLLEALQMKTKSITIAILKQGAEVTYGEATANSPCRFETALEAATTWGDQQIIETLTFMGADINTCHKEPPLSIAIQSGSKSLIHHLIHMGADLNARGHWYLSPLAAAVLVRDVETANYLLDHGADPADEKAILCAYDRSRRLLDIILHKFRKQYPKGRTGFGASLLRQSLQTHDYELLDLCLCAGCDVNSLTGNDDGTNLTVTALGLAIRKYHGGDEELISKLLDTAGGANVPTSQRVEMVAIDPSTGYRHDYEAHTIRQTAFLDAIETKSLPLVKLLISKKADVEKEATLGLKRTPLQKACEVASHTIVDLLLERNVDVNAAPAARGGATALQLAAKAGSTRIAKKLLDSGADVNAPGARFWGRSAIEYAAEYGRLNMIPVLWTAPHAKFTAGRIQNAIALAQENGHPTCAVLLQRLSSGSQGLIDASVADSGDGDRANLLC